MQLSVLSHHCCEKHLKKKKKKICTEESKRHPKIKMEQLDGNWIMDKQQQCP